MMNNNSTKPNWSFRVEQCNRNTAAPSSRWQIIFHACDVKIPIWLEEQKETRRDYREREKEKKYILVIIASNNKEKRPPTARTVAAQPPLLGQERFTWQCAYCKAQVSTSHLFLLTLEWQAPYNLVWFFFLLMHA